jgi:solute carrier family 25 folate transporter 32
VVGATISWGLYFYWYEMIKQKLFQKEERPSLATRPSPINHMMAAAIASALTTTVTNPIWVTKTRMCTSLATTSSARTYRGLIDGLIQIATVEGLRGWYKGFIPSLFGVFHGAFQFMAYEEFKSILYSYHHLQTADKLVSENRVITSHTYESGVKYRLFF